MTKKTKPSTLVSAGELTHSPFAALATKPHLKVAPGSGNPMAPVKRVQPAKPQPPPKLRVRVRMEAKWRSGKVVTRISGLPIENLEPIAARLRKALGCGATVEEDDVLLLGMLVDRASEWLERAGDLRAIKAEQVAPKSPESSVSSVRDAATIAARSADVTKRNDVRRGQRVAIVMKADQTSGALTEGIVRDLLTNSPTHPRGIKVRLESGEIGRVKMVLG